MWRIRFPEQLPGKKPPSSFQQVPRVRLKTHPLGGLNEHGEAACVERSIGLLNGRGTTRLPCAVQELHIAPRASRIEEAKLASNLCNAAAAWWISVGNQNEAGTKIYGNKNMGNNISVISHEKAGEQENIVRFQGAIFPNFPTLGMVDVKKQLLRFQGPSFPTGIWWYHHTKFQPSTAPRWVRF